MIAPALPASQRPRVAICGAGLIGRAHARLAADSSTVDLVAIVDPTPAGVELAAEHGVTSFVSLAELFAAEQTPGLGVVLATPNHLHVDQAIECLAAGVPAIVEKPVAHTIEDGERLVAAASAVGPHVPLLVGHHRRHSPLVAAASETVASEVLGRIVAVNGMATFYKPDDYFDVAPWRTQPGGGPILINMIHEVDDLRAICGDVVAVQAVTSNVTRGFAVEDTAAIILTFASGALGTFLISDAAAGPRSWEQTSGENPSYDHADDEDCYVITGTRGSLGVPTTRLRTYAEGVVPSWWNPLTRSVIRVERVDPLAAQMEHFGAVVAGRAEPLVTVTEGFATLRVTDAIARSAATGTPVTLG